MCCKSKPVSPPPCRTADAGDEDNARALFERMLAEPELVGCGELWRAYAVFEYAQGDLAAALQVRAGNWQRGMYT